MNMEKIILDQWLIGASASADLTAVLYEDGLFEVSGSGDSNKFLSAQLLPWKDQADKIKTVSFFPGTRVTSLSNWFYDCKNLVEIQSFPDGLQDLSITFCGCVSLARIPELPQSVLDLDEAFINCCSLTKVPVIPANVIYACDAFVGCSKLQGSMLLAAKLQQFAFMFQDACAHEPLTIDYTSQTKSVIDAVIATGTDSSRIVKGLEKQKNCACLF